MPPAEHLGRLEASRTANGYPGRPSLTPNAVKAMLQFSAFRMHEAGGATYDSLTQGAGAVNAVGAISLAGAINTGAAVGSPSRWTCGEARRRKRIRGHSLLRCAGSE